MAAADVVAVACLREGVATPPQTSRVWQHLATTSVRRRRRLRSCEASHSSNARLKACAIVSVAHCAYRRLEEDPLNVMT